MDDELALALVRARADLRARGAMPTPGRRGDWLWRHRRELAPVWLSAGLLVGASAAHLLTWLGLVRPVWALSALAVGIAWTGVSVLRMDRGEERVYAVAVGVAATLWVEWWWLVGLSWGALLAGLLAAGGASAIWVRHQRPRSRVRVPGTEWWPPTWPSWERWQFRRQAKRELEALLARWPAGAERARVRGVEARWAEAPIDSENYVLAVDLHGMTRKHLMENIASIASVLHAPVGEDGEVTVRVEPEAHEHHALICWPREHGPVYVDEEQEEGDEDVAGDAAGVPDPVDVLETRLAMLRLAFRRASGPISLRKAAEAANLNRNWVRKEGAPELAKRGEIVAVGRKWEVASNVVAVNFAGGER